MNIIHLRERARFRVTSETSSDPEDNYLIDLLEYRRRGWCGCVNFATKIEPKFVAGEKPDKPYCKHIRFIREYLSQLIVKLSGWNDLKPEELSRLVDRIIFRWAREEAVAQQTPKRYGTR